MIADLLPACKKYERPVKREEQLVSKDYQGLFMASFILISMALSIQLKILELLKQE